MVKTANITNREAKRDYFILETVEAGIQLKGSEVKSIRNGRANLKDSFARIDSGEVILYNMHISPYEQAGRFAPEPTRERKLLLHKAQIERLTGELHQKGLTLIPLKLYFKRGYAKVEIGLAKGKRSFDKREDLKRREHKREVERALRKK